MVSSLLIWCINRFTWLFYTYLIASFSCLGFFSHITQSLDLIFHSTSTNLCAMLFKHNHFGICILITTLENRETFPSKLTRIIILIISQRTVTMIMSYGIFVKGYKNVSHTKESRLIHCGHTTPMFAQLSCFLCGVPRISFVITCNMSLYRTSSIDCLNAYETNFVFSHYFLLLWYLTWNCGAVFFFIDSSRKRFSSKTIQSKVHAEFYFSLP